MKRYATILDVLARGARLEAGAAFAILGTTWVVQGLEQLDNGRKCGHESSAAGAGAASSNAVIPPLQVKN